MLALASPLNVPRVTKKPPVLAGSKNGARGVKWCFLPEKGGGFYFWRFH